MVLDTVSMSLLSIHIVWICTVISFFWMESDKISTYWSDFLVREH